MNSGASAAGEVRATVGARACGRAVFLIALALPFVGGCGGEGKDAEFAPFVVQRPAVQYMPEDLDVVLRLDLKRIREGLPAETSTALTAWALAGQSEDVGALLSRGMALADHVYVGLRAPEDSWRQLDQVVILEGDFSGIPVGDITRLFLPPRDLGGTLRVYDAAPSERVVVLEGSGEGDSPSSLPMYDDRTAPARLYSFGDKLWLFATPVEVDALERTVEEGHAGNGLIPPERGVFSVAARLERLMPHLRRESPRAANVLAHAGQSTASLDLGADGLGFRVEVAFSDEEAAARATAAVRVFSELMAHTSDWLKRTPVRVESVDKTTVVEGRVPVEILAGLVPSR